MTKQASLIVLGLVTLGLGYEFYTILAPFLLPLFLAGVLAMLSEPLLVWFRLRLPNRPALAAGLTTTAVIGLVILPFAIGTTLAAAQIVGFTRSALADKTWQQQMDRIQNQPWVRDLRTKVEKQLGLDQPGQPAPAPGTSVLVPPSTDPAQPAAAPPANVDPIRQTIESKLIASAGWIAERTFGAAGQGVAVVTGLANFAIAAFTLVLALYYFLADGPKLWAAFEQQIPVSRENVRQLFSQFEAAVRGVVMATLAAAVAQGLATATAIWMCGISGFFLMAILGTLSALVPVLGTWLIWVPAALYLFATGATGKAIALVLFGVIVVGTLDNVIRTYVLNSNVELHPLLAFVSVLGGLQALGLWGVFIGPVVASCLFAALHIFNQELARSPRGPTSGEPLPLPLPGPAPAPAPPSPAPVPLPT
jgi:predicted PurR-regulated permease PerM